MWKCMDQKTIFLLALIFFSDFRQKSSDVHYWERKIPSTISVYHPVQLKQSENAISSYLPQIS